VYWYTVEFGLVKQADGLRIYGAGIASSHSESIFALDDASPNRVAFNIPDDLPRVMQTDYRIDDFQETYFVINSLDDLLDLAKIDFAPLYEQIEGKTDIAPGQLLVQDILFSRGTSKYHTKA
jgi:phenylalanine-4-hydroxylase